MRPPRFVLPLACAAILSLGPVRVDAGPPAGCGCPATECIQAPAPRIVVEMAPPQVVFKEAPPATVQAPASCSRPAPAPTTVVYHKHCLFGRCCPRPQTTTLLLSQPAAAVAPAAAYSYAAPPVMAAPVAPMAYAPMMQAPPAYALVPMNMAPPPQAAPCGSGCGAGAGSGRGAGAGADAGADKDIEQLGNSVNKLDKSLKDFLARVTKLETRMDNLVNLVKEHDAALERHQKAIDALKKAKPEK